MTSTSGRASAVRLQLAPEPADAAVQEPVGDDAREDRQQEDVDEAVADTAPRQLEGEVEAAGAVGRVLRPQDVEDEDGREHDAGTDAPAQARRQERAEIDVLDADVEFGPSPGGSATASGVPRDPTGGNRGRRIRSARRFVY